MTSAPRLVVGLVGTGIEASFTPTLHEREARQQGLSYVYLTLDLERIGAEPGDIGAIVGAARRLGFRGLNVTHPCKQSVIAHLDELSPRAALVGGVNTVVFAGGKAIGHNTDWFGFEENLARGLPDRAKNEVVVLGAGGAGAAVACALLTRFSTTVDVVDVDESRANVLAARLNAEFGEGRARPLQPSALPVALDRADGLVHATPIGMADHPGLPFDAGLLRPELFVADIVYRPRETALLRAARAVGCPTLDGGGMAVFQAAEAFELFTGVHADAERMLEHLGALFAEHDPPVAATGG